MQEIANLVQNAWDWNINDFARHLGRPVNEEIEAAFLRFQEAARALRQLDQGIIEVVIKQANNVVPTLQPS